MREIHRIAEQTFQIKQLRFGNPESLLSARYLRERLSPAARTVLGNVTLNELLACRDMLVGTCMKVSRYKEYGRNRSAMYEPIWSEEKPVRKIYPETPEPKVTPKPQRPPIKPPAKQASKPVYTETISQMTRRQEREYRDRLLKERGGIRIAPRKVQPEELDPAERARIQALFTQSKGE
jgi:hypothetical protein